VAVWQWCQEIGSNERMHKMFRLGRERIKIFAIDETGVKVAGEDAYLFVAYEPFVCEQDPWTVFRMESELDLSGDVPERPNPEIRSPSDLDRRRRLVFAGMRVYESQTPYLHARKLALEDDGEADDGEIKRKTEPNRSTISSPAGAMVKNAASNTSSTGSTSSACTISRNINPPSSEESRICS
jgi:hypothetical protein